MICYENIVDVAPLFSYLNEKWYVHNIFTTFLQQILSDKLLLVVIDGKLKI